MSYITKTQLENANKALKQMGVSAVTSGPVKGKWLNLLARKGFPVPFATVGGKPITVDGSFDVLNISQEEADERFADMEKAETALNEAVQAYIDVSEELKKQDEQLRAVIPSWNGIEGTYDLASPEYQAWHEFRKPINAMEQFAELNQAWIDEFPLRTETFDKLCNEHGYTFAIPEGESLWVAKNRARFASKLKDFRELLVQLCTEAAIVDGCRKAIQWLRGNNIEFLDDDNIFKPNEDEEMEARRAGWLTEKSTKEYEELHATVDGAEAYVIEVGKDKFSCYTQEDVINVMLMTKLYNLVNKAYGDIYTNRQEFLDVISHPFLEAARNICVQLQNFSTVTDANGKKVFVPFSYEAYTYDNLGNKVPVYDENGEKVMKFVTYKHLLARFSDFFGMGLLDDTDLAYIVGCKEYEVTSFRTQIEESRSDAKQITLFKGKHGFLHNFYSIDVDIVDNDGIHYNNVESYFQAQKIASDNAEQRLNLKQAFAEADPREAKKLGTNKKLNIRADWEGIKEAAMLAGLQQKFAPNTILAKRLVATGNKELIENNYHNDTFWGKVDGKGENKLGQLLMKVRADLVAAGVTAD